MVSETVPPRKKLPRNSKILARRRDSRRPIAFDPTAVPRAGG